jgi:hypothetical protein
MSGDQCQCGCPAESCRTKAAAEDQRPPYPEIKVIVRRSFGRKEIK